MSIENWRLPTNFVANLMIWNGVPPILDDKHYREASAFTPENLLREARRQKGMAATPVPAICILDPDGDLVRQLESAGRTRRDSGWPCYHTDLHRIREGDLEFGIVGRAVGAPFAVLIA